MNIAATFRRPKTLFVLGVVLMLSLVGVASFGATKVLAGDCDENAIMYCGTGSASQFVGKVRANNDGHGHTDLQAIYADYGLAPAEYSRFVTTAKPGVAFKNGNIVVGNQIVATNTNSIGRLASFQGAGFFTKVINGHTYYGNTNARAFATDALPVMVMFNSKGVMEFAVMNSCGNPMGGTKVAPTYSCDALRKSPVAGKANTYNFSTAASAANNASIAKVVYDFGDGASKTELSPSTTVQHTYTRGGNFTAKVTVYVNLPGNQQVVVQSVHCQTIITVLVPFARCVELAGPAIDQSKMSFLFVATASFGNGATFTSADFNFGDGHSANGVAPNGTTASANHTYAQPGTFNAFATLHFMANGVAVTAPTCKALVTPTTPPTPECKPGVPVGSPECTPCQFNPSLPSNSPECVAPPGELPNTGAGNTIALVLVAAVAGFLVYRQIIFRRHKRAFLAADSGTSDLPLGQPLDSEAPLAGTPLAKTPGRRSFRRRQF
ncbi:MAG: PKD domain-containing protein [Candidatus Saccharimonadales bacterium]